MKGQVLRQFLNLTHGMDDMEYLLSRVAYSAAPTILDRKPSTLISFEQGSRNLNMLWERYGEKVGSILGLQHTELRNSGTSRSILFYKTDLLNSYLQKHQTSSFLKKIGYPEGMDVEKCLEILKSGFVSFCPHEVGVFLGIPLEDVKGFIENKGKGSLVNSYWKVYHNMEQALHTFALYDDAKEIVINSIFNRDNSFLFTAFSEKEILVS